MRHFVVLACLATLTLLIPSFHMRLAIGTTPQSTWVPIGLAGEHVEMIAIDPQQPATLFAGTRDHGVFKSTGGGGQWHAVNSGLTSPAVSNIAIDPHTTTTVYVSVRNVSKEMRGGLYKSTDGGASWRVIVSDPPFRQAISAEVTAVVIDPQTPTTIYVGTLGGVFKTTDGGGSFRSVTTGFSPWGSQIYTLSIDPRTPTTLYARTSRVSEVFRSIDGGETWNVIRWLNPDAPSPMNLFIDPQTPTTLYGQTGGDGVLKSTDGGQSWHATNVGLADLKVNDLAINPQNTSTLYAGTWHGIFESFDGGGTWHAINEGLTDLRVTALAVDPHTPTTVYAGTWGTGVFVRRSASELRVGLNPLAGSPAETGSVAYLSVGDDGNAWIAVETWRDRSRTPKTALYTLPSQHQWKKQLETSARFRRLWFFGSRRVSAWVGGDGLGQGGGTIVHTADGGARWRFSPELPQRGWDILNMDVSFINQVEGWALALIDIGAGGRRTALYRTVDGGNHWAEIPPGTIKGLGPEPKAGIVFRDRDNGWITSPLYRTRDGGMTWERQVLSSPEIRTPSESITVERLKFFSARDGVVLALVGGGFPVVFSTSDGGHTWGNPRRLPIDRLPEDFIQWDFLSPAVWAAVADQTLWITLDAGRTWLRRAIPLPPTHKIGIAVASPLRILAIGHAPWPIRPDQGRSRWAADHVLETSDAGLHWARIALPSPP